MTLDDYFHLFAAAMTNSNITFKLLKDSQADSDKLSDFKAALKIMSSQVTSLVWKQQIDAVDKLILLAFADNAMHDGLSVLSIPELRKLTCLDLDTVRLRLKKLETKDFILVDPQYSDKGVKLRYLYILNTHKLKENYG